MKTCQECNLPAFSSSLSSSSRSDESINIQPSALDPPQPDANNHQPSSSDASKWSFDDESSDSEKEGSLDEIKSDEMNECKFFTKYDGTYDMPENIFTLAKVDELKKRERIVIERNIKGYYWSKLKDRELYEEIMQVYKRFIQPDMLKQVWHK